LIGSGGSPAYTNSVGVPWTAAYINGDAQGDLTADLRSDIAAETRAKMVYEYLLQFTNDPHVKNTLRFLMTREIAHFQMFEAALDSIKPNFPPGILQGDPRYSNLYFNMSSGNDYHGAWNEGTSTKLNEQMQYIDDPVEHVMQTNGLVDQEISGTDRTEKMVQKKDRELSAMRSQEVNAASPLKEQQWSDAFSTNGAGKANAKPSSSLSKTKIKSARAKR
jgi:Mn-containing catalase